MKLVVYYNSPPTQKLKNYFTIHFSVTYYQNSRMQKVLESKYLNIIYTPHLKLLSIDYQLTTEEITEQEWKELMHSILRNIGKYDPYFLISDNRDMKFVISLDLQVWFAKEIYEFIQKQPIRLEKFALILPQDLIAELSVQQTVDESKAMQLKSPYKQKIFTEVIEAEKWIFEN